MIPELLLEEILLGEKEEKDFYEKYGKEEIKSALENLRKSDAAILEMYPAQKMQKEIMKKAIMASNPELSKPAVKKNRFASFAVSKAWKFSAAAAFVLMLAGSFVIRNYNFRGTAPTERVKGAGANHQIRLYRQDGNDAVLLKNGETASENDLIQITYIPGKYSYGVIFSVDGNGNVTRHFPDNTWVSSELEKTGEEVPLSFSYSLDDAPDYECFIFVASKNSFDLSQIEKIKKESFSIDFLKQGSYLPEGCDGSIFVLHKNQDIK